MCQSQETGAQVGGGFRAEAVRGRLVLLFRGRVATVREISAPTGGQTFLWRWCQQLLAVCQLKAFRCLVGELLIKLSNRVRECRESGVM